MSDSSSQLEAESDSDNQIQKQIKAKSNSRRLIPHPNRVGQPNPRSTRRSLTDKAIVEMTESDHPGCQVTKLLAIRIIYPISDSQWVSPIQVVLKKSGTTMMKNRHDELATNKDHFPLPFIDQVLERLAEKSHYCFLDGFSGYMQIHIALVDQHKTTFTCRFDTFAYTRMPFGLCNALSTFLRCMISISVDLLEDYMEVFMDDFTVYAESFEAC
ncbi:hypothetical protein CR513_21290, partial [Mucuna pruriens]